MRVVAGTARGRRLAAPTGTDVRPTGDRVREATFNALGSLDVIRDALVLDLFGGSGALGIEALSRGAAHATFVDSARRSVEAIRANLATCDLEDRSSVVPMDALAYLTAQRTRFDLALLDPPYAYDRWDELMGLLVARVVVIESDRAIDPGPERVVQRQRRYGGTVVTIAVEPDREDRGRRPLEDR